MSRAGRDAWRTMFELVVDGENHRRLHDAAAALGLSPGHLKALLHLSPGVAVPMRELTEHWRCDASYVTTLADGLQRRGLVERRPHATDRRVKTLVLTRAGTEARERATALLHEPPSSFSALTGEEQRRLRDLLAKVAGADPELGRNREIAATG